MGKKDSVQKISVIVPKSPFVQPKLQAVKHCLAALDVEKLMEWWPGQPHSPHRDSTKVRDIQRSLDWKRVAQIAAYLLQREVIDAPRLLNKHFAKIYEPKKLEPGREWPPKVPSVIGFERSAYPTFSNVLLHVNGARIEPIEGDGGEAAKLIFDEQNKSLQFSVIDGQHRINGAYLALKILQEEKPDNKLEIPAEVFLDLDEANSPPRHQAQIFIDVNFYQKKVDRSLVADLFPTARGSRTPLDDKERAQDVGRKLMLEVGPLVGMIQIPGIKFGVKDVVTLATLNSAIEDVLEPMVKVNIKSLEEQTAFLAQCLGAWLDATGRRHDPSTSQKLDHGNVAYQGRVLVSFLALLPGCIWKLQKSKTTFISESAAEVLKKWLQGLMERAGLIGANGMFIDKDKFRRNGFLGSGGIGRFRDTLWAAAIGTREVGRLSVERKSKLAQANRAKVYASLSLS